ncbi:MAG: GNAT family N-acetyltransferase [Acidimicrobiia bacterium]|nr:GNAT family N-acetyltransferase [Acidimicrobiia bacterium]
MDATIRPVTRNDEPFLWDMLYEAIFVPPGEPILPRSILNQADLAHYVTDFGLWPGDLGFVAELAGNPVGAGWVRRFRIDDPGYGFVDEDTPELSIAIRPAHRGGGIGTRLIEALVAVVPRCSLSTDRRNRAVNLYERHGFCVVATDGDTVTMLRTG